jgi:hypothetical protein
VKTQSVCWISCAASLLALLLVIASLVCSYSVHEFRERRAAFLEGCVRLNRALCNKLSVPVQWNCGTAVRTGNWVLWSISPPVVTVKVLVCCKCSPVCIYILLFILYFILQHASLHGNTTCSSVHIVSACPFGQLLTLSPRFCIFTSFAPQVKCFVDLVQFLKVSWLNKA